MKIPHRFLTESLSWLGEGTIRLTASEDQLRYLTRWEVQITDGGRVLCQQTVEIPGVGQTMVNRYQFSSDAEGRLEVSLENEAVEKVQGKGACDEKSVVWEFRCPEKHFEGFEIYEKLESDRYRVHGEYYGGDEVRTIIEGQIWEKKEG